MPFILGTIASQKTVLGAYELISSTVLASSATSVTFPSIPQTYKHLQMRVTTRNQYGEVWLTFNGDATSNYNFHSMWGNGAGVASDTNVGMSSTNIFMVPVTAATTNVFGAGTVDLLDYTSTIKFKTVRALGGYVDSPGEVRLRSGLWRSTAAVNTISVGCSGTGFVPGSRFSLYGIAG